MALCKLVAFTVVIGLLMLSTGCDDSGAVPTTQPPTVITTPLPPIVATVISKCEEPIRGKYIVSLNVERIGDGPPGDVDGVSVREVAADMAQRYSLTVGHIFDSVLGGFSAEIPDSELANVIADSRVKYVEPDCLMKLIE